MRLRVSELDESAAGYTVPGGARETVGNGHMRYWRRGSSRISRLRSSTRTIITDLEHFETMYGIFGKGAEEQAEAAADAQREAAAAQTRQAQPAQQHYCMVGYEIENTLTENGVCFPRRVRDRRKAVC